MAENKNMSELELLELEEKRLRVESLRFTVENERARREQILRAHKMQQESLDQALKAVQAEQAFCKHKKGGKNLEGVLNGNDTNYSVQKHTYPWGELTVICTRCGKEWRKPSEALKASDPKEWRRQNTEYLEAVNFPTDNEPSGTQIFVVTPAQRQAARA